MQRLFLGTFIPALVLLIAVHAQAEVRTFNDRAAFEAAAGVTQTDDLNDQEPGRSYVGGPVDVGDFSIERGAVCTLNLSLPCPLGNFLTIATDLPFYEPAEDLDVDGSVFAATFFSEDEVWFEIEFEQPIKAFGFDTRGLDLTEEEAGIIQFTASVFIDGFVGPLPATPPENGQPRTFFGFVSDKPFTRVSVSPRLNYLFSFDNVTYSCPAELQQGNDCVGPGEAIDLPLVGDVRIDGDRVDPQQAYANFSGRDTILVHRWYPSSGLLQFDSNVVASQSINKATLVLTPKAVKSPGEMRIRALSAPFDENSVTFETRPQALDEGSTVALSSANVGQEIEVDVTQAVRSAARQNAQTIGFMFDTDDPIRALFDSKEAYDGKPARLRVVIGEAQPNPVFGIQVLVRDVNTGEVLPQYRAARTSGPFEVVIEGSGENCVGSYVVSLRDAANDLVVFRQEIFEIGAGDDENTYAGEPLSIFGWGVVNVSATCNAGTLNTSAHDATSFVID